MKSLLDYMDKANNVYRTKKFIVCQTVSLIRKSNGVSLIVTEDTYILRTPKRDFGYEIVFRVRGDHLDGKRIQSAIYLRKYVY